MKKLYFIILSIVSVAVLTGCNLAEFTGGTIKGELKGRSIEVVTYDENSQLIDRIKGKSININADSKFALKSIDGDTVEKSSVINIVVGDHSMTHVGSSLLAVEDGLTNILDEYSKKVDIENTDRTVPFLNKMVSDLKNITTGKDKVILIRSQTGKPLATFVGNDVSMFATSIDKSTGLIIDGKYLLIYRCDYTVYDTALLQ